MNFKSQIAPKGLQFNASDFFISDKYATVLTVISYPRYIGDGYLSDLTNIPGVKDVIHPFQGRVIDLHNTPVYRNASDKMYFKQISGRFYFYDETIVNGRAKITATQHMIKKNPSYILGYININQ